MTETVSNVEQVVFNDASVRLVGAGGYATIQAAIDAASAGETILIAPGTYNEHVVINKAVTLVGGGAPGDVVIQGTFTTDNPIVTTVTDFLETAASYSGAAGNGITVSADDVTISNLTVSGFLTGIELGSNDGLTISDVDITEGVTGIRKGTAANVTNFEMSGGTISDIYFGIYAGAAIGAGAFDGITIDGVTFDDLGEKGIYAEQLSNAVITNITMNDVGQFGRGPAFGPATQTGEFGNGIDINLKYGAYSNIEISNFTFTGVGSSAGVDGFPISNPAIDFGGAIVIKARDDGPYSGSPATLDGVTISDGSIDGTSTGIRIGEPGTANASPINVVVNGVTIDNAAVADFDNVTTATLEVNGTSGDDVIDVSPGATGSVVIDGGAGADDLTGGGGKDTLTGGEGNDTLDGGGGTDTASFAGNAADYSISVSGGTVTVTDNNAGDGDEGADTVADTEIIGFSDGSVLIVGAGGFATIQEAVDAAGNGDTIMIAEGTYTEQVQIDGKTGLTLVGIGEVTIKAPADVVETARSSSDREMHSVVTIENSTGITLDNVNVDGDGRANTIEEGGGAGSAQFTGVFVRNASATLEDVDITGVRDPLPGGTTIGTGDPIVSGNQRGVALQVDNDMLMAFTMTGGSISDFQKNATVFSGADLNVTGVTITGGGDQPVNAQNGIQVLNSTGTIANNIITNIGYAGPALAYSGMILAYGNTDLDITGNTITGTNGVNTDSKVVGIYILDFGPDNSGGSITGNIISHVDSGIEVTGGLGPDGMTITGNTVTDIDANDPFAGNVTFDPTTSANNTVEGSAGDDVLNGGSGDDDLSGLAGNDTITGGGGTDSIDGGSGDDTIIYNSGAELTAGETVDGGADYDEIVFTPAVEEYLTISANVINVEAVSIGGTDEAHIDASASLAGLTISGNGAGNALIGSAYADDIDGGDGSDHILGLGGNDTIEGGAGDDYAIYGGNIAGYDISTDGVDVTVTDTNAGNGDNGTDTLSGFENIFFMDQNVIVVGGDSEFTSIQAAIDAASDGDTIVVLDGVYTENVNVNKAVTLITSNAGVGGTDPGRDAATGTGEVTIDGTVTISAAGAVTLDGLRFLNSVLGGNTLTIGTGFDHQILNSIFYSTVAGGGSGDRAISMGPMGTGNVTISGNYITGSQTGLFSTASWDRGLWTDGGGVNIDISGNTFQYTRTAINADAASPSLITISGNTITSAGSGVSYGVNHLNVVVNGMTFENVGDEFNLRNITADVTFDAGAAIATLNTGYPGYDFVVVLGGTGNDTLTGSAYDDALDGNNLNNNADDDTLNGLAGDDLLYGKAGDDTLNGGADNDTIAGGAGTDTITGGSGDDSIVFNAGSELTAGETVDGGDDVDTVVFTSGAGDTLTLTTNVINIEKVLINSSVDSNVDASALSAGLEIDGNAYANVITGTSGTDDIDGGDGDDTLTGGEGDDTIAGGDGADTATYTGNLSDFDISTNGVSLTVNDNNAGDGDEGSDTLSSVETLDFADASVLVVGTGGYATIQAAIDAASDGDTIVVLDGVYTENVNVNKAVTLITSNAGVGGTNPGRDAATGTGEVTIDGTVTISAAGAVTLDGLRFLNSVLGGNTLTIGTGFDHQILNSIFYSTVAGGGNSADDRAISMGPLASGNVTISGNYITGSEPGLFGTASWGRGLWTDGGGVNIDISGNTFQYTRTAINADAASPSLITVSGNTITSAGSGVSYGVNHLNVVVNGMTFENVGDEFNLRNITADVTFDAGAAITALTTVNTTNDFVVVLGGTGNDTLTGSVYDDALDGNNLNNNADADTLNGLAGDDLLYGKGGDDTLNGGADDDTVDGGDGDDTVTGGAGADALTGGNGIDTLDYAGSAAVTVNLAANTASGGDATGDTISGFENVIGTAFADTITGDGNDNDLVGGDGNDLLNGGAGGDTLNGGNGIDTASYAGSAAGVTINLGTGSVTGGDATGDMLISIENILGSAEADTITGDNNANTLEGGDGDDVIIGQGGDDTLIGGAGADALIGSGGTDTVNYSASATGVNVNLATTVGTGGDAEGDTLSGIEIVRGSNFADTITGDSLANTLFGQNGSDTINGGDGDDTIAGGNGADVLDGGAGVDTLNAAGTSANMTINLATNFITGGDSTGDTIANFENVIAANGNDTVTGTAGANRLDGGSGNDILSGGAGADVLIGGSGTDTATYADAASGVTVNLGNGTGSAGDANGDTLSGIENLIGSSHGDTLLGNSLVNILDGGDGDDVLTGGAGADFINGGNGNDTASYATAASGVTVNLGTGINTGSDAAGDVLTSIANLIGSGYNDTLTGDADANALYGGSGVDTLDGGDGDDLIAGGILGDVLIGGLGSDTLDYSASGNVSVNLGANTVGGSHAAGDTISGFENVLGSNFADSLVGSSGDNTMNGNGGNDTLFADAGADTLIGGLGVDTVTFQNSVVGVTVNLLTGTGSGGDAEGDTYAGIEGVRGTNAVDIITGDAADNSFNGAAGNDIISGGDGNDTIIGGNGADTLDGGNGVDTLNASGTSGNQTVNLATNFITGGDSTGDTIVNFENVLTGSGNDSLTGSADANLLNGGGGSDTLTGGLGTDTLIGGTGTDSFVFTSLADSAVGASRDTIGDFSQSQLDVMNLAAIDAVAGGGDDAFTFIASAAFTNVAGQLRYFTGSGTTVVEGDVDGDGEADFQIGLTGIFALTGADFVL
ncbi:beta strand repeat-containing protein [Aestuariivirga sp.]|uniref:beta strand repeat-containing protein n=1 Tax=Aestuariivirga sp. TaxID=2650926 RepID=UPI0035942E8A